MKTRLISFALLSLFVTNGYAKKISENEAKSIACRFMGIESARKDPARQNAAAMNLELRYEAAEGYYVFGSTASEGFVIVAADDEGGSGVLAYADTGVFDPDQMPPAMKEWLEESAKNSLQKSSTKGNAVVAPLLKTTWGQGRYYNDLCPVVDGSHCPTGCVATALAQVMNYYRWPEVGYGNVVYLDKVIDTEIDVDFNTSYDWDAMLNSYAAVQPSQRQIDAVATLMRDAGAATQMVYRLDGSGSSLSYIPSAAYRYLKYSKDAKCVYAHNVSADEWTRALHDELDAKRPVIYSGASGESGGHAFVCDGYDDAGYLHINWGWTGSCDGYFLPSGLDPSVSGVDYSFSQSQCIVVGFQPDKNWSPAEEEEAASRFSWKLQDGVLSIYGTGEIPYATNSRPWQSQKAEVTKLVLKKGITVIPREMFKDHSNLKEVVFPSTLKDVYPYAFAYCGIENLEFPEQLQNIYGYAFYSNPVENVLISANLQHIEGSAFSDCSRLGSYFVDQRNANYSSYENVLYNKDLTQLIACPAILDAIDIPSTVTSFGTNAFYGCLFEEYIIPEQITEFGTNVFSYCPNLKYLKLPESMTEVPEGLCSVSQKLKAVTFGQNVKVIHREAFFYTALESVVLPATLTKIEDNAFSYCSKLSHITCLAEKAPTLTSQNFKSLPGTGTLTVPIGSDYAAWLSMLPTGWSIEYTDVTGLDEVQQPESEGIMYDLQGKRISTLPKGIYILNGKKYVTL